MDNQDSILFNLPKTNPNIIKVIGVGGGGSNAIKNMYKEGIHDVTFVVCNTDKQALDSSEIPIRIQLGPDTCKGLGAGADPAVGEQAAEESIEEVGNLFKDGTQMVFITAGMGGGTGTGAAPVVARVAKEMGMLTVGIVTLPFKFERENKILKAIEGVERIAAHVDALLVINNERLYEMYSNLTVDEGFRVADRMLTTATKSIAEIITVEGTINLDFRDVSKVLKDGGVAIMSTGTGQGEKRLNRAINNALNSPLLNNNDIYNSRKVLFNIYQSPTAPLIIEEMEELNSFMARFKSAEIDVIWGLAKDDTLGDEVKITLLATGFNIDAVPGMEEALRNRRNEQIIRNEREQIQQREENQAKIDKYYGPSKIAPKRAVRTFLFLDEDLDNDTLIAAIEGSPTYRRTFKELNELETHRHPAPEVAVSAPAPTEETAADTTTGEMLIQF